MARRLNRLVSIVLSAAVVVLSSGLDAQRAAAQTFSGRAAPVSATPQLGMVLGAVLAPSVNLPVLSLSAPGLSAPSALAASPILAAPSVSVTPKPVTPAAAIAGKILAAAPALKALAKHELGGSAASIAGRDLEDVLTGARSAKTSASDSAVSGVASALSLALSAPSAPEAPKASEVPAAAPAPFKSISSASSYRAHRVVLRAVAALTGAVFTLPQAGPALSAKIIASAAEKSLVLSDFDDTLAGYNELLPADKVSAIRAIRAAGKRFAVISDRGDTKRPGQAQLTVFESLESIPAADRAGMYVAANSGGKIYLYDAQGVPQKVHEATILSEDQIAKIKEAAAAAKARLSEVGAVQHAGDEKVPGESFNSYGYALMLKPGSSQDSVKGAARILNEELAKRGFEVEVQPRFAKSAENPPYATFSIITKAEAASYIAGVLKIEAKDALVIGDAMFIPRDAKTSGFLTRLGERLSGRPQAKTGNETDRNMTKNLPGVLALGVGTAMDPRTVNGWALAGHGPAVTQKVLEAVASKTRGARVADKKDRVETYTHLAILGMILAAGAAGIYVFASVLGEMVRMGEDAMRAWQPFGRDAGFYLGGTTLGMVGMAGMLGHVRSILSNPNQSYPQALKRATEIAVESGAKAADVRFIEATANMPVRDGAQWKYTFSFPNARNGTDLVYVDFDSFFGGAQDFRARVYSGAAASANAVPFAMSEHLFSRGVSVSPSDALDLVRKATPEFGAGVSVSLGVQEEPVSGDKDAWYRIYDDKGNFAQVNGRTAEVRVVKAAARAAKTAPAGLKHAYEPNELYALALENMKQTAGKDGVKGGIRFLSAVHETRYFNGAWIGDEWRFFFGVGGGNGGMQYMVPARRTMITETMMDAFEPVLKGPISAEQLASGVDSALFNRAVVTTPDAALAGVNGVARVSLLPRVDAVSGDKDLWYSLQDAGSEVASVNARTGEVLKTAVRAPDSALKSFGLWLIGAALVAAIYGAFYWAMAHAPAAVPQGVPEGYNGPVPSIDQIFHGMGGVLGLGFLAGTIKRGAKKAAATTISDDDIRASAAGVISYKGRPWSQTEYNSVYYPAIESLKARGATQLQLALFETLCAEAPVKGGSFNPWSGD
jgi:hydroxymethylpyrimidine pyrophosphatase-like HAD family hydrolase